ncbi:MAG: MBL fold metallo-hydrolase [Clostridia bacterium]|nr:MBL fold metallo-hydrolase [Clostridia bacterium]
MKLFRRINWKAFSNLETIEEKSFWIVAPTVALVGMIGLTTSGSYESMIPMIAAALSCFILPILLMIFVSKKKNYHSAYPLLCIFTGAVATPVTFIFGGGFLSSMPLFCVVTAGITGLCYSKRWRFLSVFSCLATNTLAFLYVYFNGSPFPLKGSEMLNNSKEIWPVYNDMFLGYYLASLALFISVHFVINDIRRYSLNQETLQQYFDKEKRKEILNKALGGNISSESNHKKAVILFADISNFTTITENMPSTLISKFLNEFFSTAGKYIHSTGGIIDKYIGDCVMAYWFDDANGNCVLNAVESMLNMKLDLLKKAESIYQEYGTELNYSVGIAYGDVIFGDIGSDTMHDYTVIGDAVNTASRIESFAVSGEMLISDSAAKMVKGAVILESVEADHFFKGKNKPIDLYRIVGLASQKQEFAFQEREPYEYTVSVCGCRGSFPVSGLRFSEYGGETSCYVVKKDDYAVIIDCGTGLKNAVSLLDGCKNIDILLTHVHYDHILGFLMSKFPAQTKVRIFGQFDKWDVQSNTLDEFMEHPYWPVELSYTEKVSIKLGEKIPLDKEMTAAFYPSDHPDDACVIQLMCKDKKVVFLADCENAERLEPGLADNAELVFFDGMFDDGDAIDHTGWGHGTWQAGLRFTDGKNIKKMVITHHNPELGDHSLMLRETQARHEKSNVSFAKTGDVFMI